MRKFILDLLNQFLINFKTKYYPFIKPSLNDIRSNDWIEYLRRRDNLILAIFLIIIIYNFFPSCNYQIWGIKYSYFYNDSCYAWISFIDKIQATNSSELSGSYMFFLPTVFSTLFALAFFFIAKYLIEIRIQNNRKRLK
jgi:hypothetical protein